MNNTFRGLMAAAVIGGASITGAATLPANAAEALTPVTVKKVETKRLVRIGNQHRLHQLARQIRALKIKRRSLIAKLRGLQSGRLVALRLSHGNCRVMSTRTFRFRLASAVRSGRITPARARFIMRNARIRSARCQNMLRVEIRRTSVRIARLQRIYLAMLCRRG